MKWEIYKDEDGDEVKVISMFLASERDLHLPYCDNPVLIHSFEADDFEAAKRERDKFMGW